MNNFELIRNVLGFVVSLGVGEIVSDALKAIKPNQVPSPLKKVSTKIGGFAIGYYFSGKIGDYIDDQIVEFAEERKKLKEVTEKKGDEAV